MVRSVRRNWVLIVEQQLFEVLFDGVLKRAEAVLILPLSDVTVRLFFRTRYHAVLDLFRAAQRRAAPLIDFECHIFLTSHAVLCLGFSCALFCAL